MAPAWVGLALTVGHVLLGFAFYAFVVAPEPAAAWSAYRDGIDAAVVFGLLVGYGPAALAYARRGQRAALRALRGCLRASDAELAAARRELEAFDAATLRVVGIVSSTVTALVTLFTTGLLDELGPRHPVLIWVVWQNVLAAWLVSRAIAHDLRGSWLLARWTERWAEVELLDPAPLAPLARRGLQSALLIILAASIFTLVFGLGNVSPAVPFTQALAVGVAAFALLRPSLGVHRRLRAARRRERARLDRAIRATRARAGSEARLAALLTLRQHVQAARAWPFDLGTLGRFVLVAAIGLGSWLGGALVERLVDLLLG